MFTEAEKVKIREKARIAEEHLLNYNLRPFYGLPKDQLLIRISDAYPGVWLETSYSAVVFSKMYPQYKQVARNMVELFLNCQTADGQFPLAILDRPDPKDPTKPEIFDFQIQEVEPFGMVCLEAYALAGDHDLLVRMYDAFTRWDAWLCANRMTSNRGLIEMFCGYDTGMDNSGRNLGLSCPGNFNDQNAAVLPIDDVVPILAPDMNALFWSDRMSLAKMADLLGKPEEAAMWRKKAGEVKQLIFRYCFNEEDLAFYDVDKHGNQRKNLSIVQARMFYPHFLEGELAEKIFQRHIEKPEEFNTPCPLPSMAANDPTFRKEPDRNNWGYYVQTGTALRTLLWLDHYGKHEYQDRFLEAWIRAWTDSEEVPFGQEIDPITCEPSLSSPWNSYTLLSYLAGARRFGII